MTDRRRRAFIALARRVLSLRPGTDYEATVRQVRSDVALRSGGSWALAFAILIASVGLNVNSTAVIIGAMLISPLMGPIVGAGVALGISDLLLLRRSLRSLLIATAIALVTSTIYFAISPLAEAQSELLARTRPTLYDVLIALFGGSAGIIAASRQQNKSQVVPGVAIATALMPPLCTAGFGIAHGDGWIFLGAMHLFLINALFICLSTLAFVRFLGFERVVTHDETPKPRIRAVIVGLTLALVLPSIYTGFQVVRETKFQGAARRFVSTELAFADRTLINQSLRYGRDSSTVDVTLLGEPVGDAALDSIRTRMASYGLSRTRLIIRQPLGQQPSVAELTDVLRQGLLQELRTTGARPGTTPDAATSSRSAVGSTVVPDVPLRALTSELSALYPSLVSLAIGRVAVVGDTSSVAPRRISVLASWRRVPPAAEQARVAAFIALRLSTDSVDVSHLVAHAATETRISR